MKQTIIGNKIIIHTTGVLCETPDEILESDLFRIIVQKGIEELVHKQSCLLEIFEEPNKAESQVELLVQTLQHLLKLDWEKIPSIIPEASQFFKDRALFSEFVEYLYNYWRGYERFLIFDTESYSSEKRPYRELNRRTDMLSSFIRGIYRDMEENITGTHPRIYRQVAAGAEIAAICLPRDINFPAPVYEKLSPIRIIRQIILAPPLLLDPPMNKRTGTFLKIDKNPCEVVDLDSEEWLCYPAKVGSLFIYIYFHEKMFDLGFSLCNLFEIADKEDLQRKPDAIYLFGVPGDQLYSLADFPTVFYEDTENEMMVAACPGKDEFGYFGYLKKMVLTLHNVIMMKEGRLPFHGALVNILLKGGQEATILLIGDTGAGKSETLEAFRTLGREYIRDMTIIADDMGSLVIDEENNQIIGYGTETGAFLRIDDLKPGYAFGQMDRSIIMSPAKTNARIVLPVTTFEVLNKGYKIDYILYANNYEEVDEEHKIIERFDTAELAFRTFRDGMVMSKGTTTSKGIVHSYFANIFGPPQYKVMHDAIANKYFAAFFDHGIFVGQIRTRLGIPGWEMDGPEAAAKAMLETISKQ